MMRSGEKTVWIPPVQWTDLLKLFLLCTAVIWLLMRGSDRMGYHWQWYRVSDFILTAESGRITAGPLLRGLAVTLRITGISLVLATLLGLVTAFFRLSNSFLARALARGYLEIVRNTPLLVQLFFVYFVMAPVLDMNRFTSAVLALSLFEGAYASEIFRAGIISIHKGQWEAAFSLGMSLPQTYRHVVLPQAIRRILPPLTSQAISLIKDSALVSTIAVYDLTMEAQSLAADTFLVFELWFTVAGIYLLMTVSLSLGVNLMERRLRGGSG
ncbi:MAG: amino acid ABC transporter permease [Desulfobacterales bacterium]